MSILTIEDCYEEAEMDAYSGKEIKMGWATCIEDNLSDVKNVTLLGNPNKKFEVEKLDGLKAVIKMKIIK